MDLIPRNKCPFDCPYYDTEESDDNWYQWCKHEKAKEEETKNGDYVLTCPLTGQSIEED